MKKQLITCDHCGVEMDEICDYCDIELTDFNFEIDATTDLCRDCYNELSCKIAEFCNIGRTNNE